MQNYRSRWRSYANMRMSAISVSVSVLSSCRRFRTAAAGTGNRSKSSADRAGGCSDPRKIPPARLLPGIRPLKQMPSIRESLIKNRNEAFPSGLDGTEAARQGTDCGKAKPFLKCAAVAFVRREDKPSSSSIPFSVVLHSFSFPCPALLFRAVCHRLFCRAEFRREICSRKKFSKMLWYNT